MTTLNRRTFLKVSAAATLLTALPASPKATGARVVVVGGGFGGATCARYLRLLNPALQVTLVERERVFYTCPVSNWVLGGLREMADIRHGYDTLQDRYGVEVIHDSATGVDPQGRRVTLAGGSRLPYDRLVLSPGVEMDYDAVAGYDQAAVARMPHAWQAGPQTQLLRSQLRTMEDGGVVIIAAPGNPYRCPPGPYERASLIAHYLKTHKPRSKIIILDTKDSFSKQGLFQAGWQALYPGMIDWIAGSDGGIVEAVEPASLTLRATFGFDDHRGDVVNFIPPQRAAAIARQAGLTDAGGWCPVDQLTFESTLQPGIHVIGDAAIAGAMPKSGFAANSQAKVVAAAIGAALDGRELPSPSYANTCYSLVGPDYGISVAAVYRLEDGRIHGVEGAGGVSPMDAPARFRAREALYAQGWYDSIIADMFG